MQMKPRLTFFARCAQCQNYYTKIAQFPEQKREDFRCWEHAQGSDALLDYNFTMDVICGEILFTPVARHFCWSIYQDWCLAPKKKGSLQNILRVIDDGGHAFVGLVVLNHDSIHLWTTPRLREKEPYPFGGMYDNCPDALFYLWDGETFTSRIDPTTFIEFMINHL